MLFTVSARRLNPARGDPDGTAWWAEKAKDSLRQRASSYDLITEGEVVRHGIRGWQTETVAALQGHDVYFVKWMVVTNGIAYDLSTWGPSTLGAQVKQEADRMASSFELIPMPPDAGQ